MVKDQVPSNAEVVRREGRRWPIIVILIVAALLFATAVTLGARWVYREVSEDDSTKATPTETQTTPQSEQAPAPPGASPKTDDNQNQPLPDTGG